MVEKLKTTYKVTEQEILDSIGRSAIEHITSDDIMVLIGIGQAIKDGDTTIDEAFRSIVKKPAAEESAAAKEAARIKTFIEKSKNIKQLEEAEEYCLKLEADHELRKLYNAKADELAGKE